MTKRSSLLRNCVHSKSKSQAFIYGLYLPTAVLAHRYDKQYLTVN